MITTNIWNFIIIIFLSGEKCNFVVSYTQAFRITNVCWLNNFLKYLKAIMKELNSRM